MGDNDGSVLQFQSHGTWTEGGRSSGDFVFYGVDGMSSDLLNMNWFFNDAECWNPDMPPKYDENGDVVGYYYNRTMDPAPAGWKPSLSCVDNGGVAPENLFSAFNSNWRPQGNYNVQVITAEGLAAVPSHSTLESTLPTLPLMVLRDLPPLPETLLPLISELRTSETHRLSWLLLPRESQMLSDAHSADKS